MSVPLKVDDAARRRLRYADRADARNSGVMDMDEGDDGPDPKFLGRENALNDVPTVDGTFRWPIALERFFEIDIDNVDDDFHDLFRTSLRLFQRRTR